MNKMTIDNTKANHQKFVFLGGQIWHLGTKTKAVQNATKMRIFLGKKSTVVSRHYFRQL
jgi:hypothetical protein